MERRKHASIGTLFGLAKSLSMDSDDLHAYVHRQTGKESLRLLTQGELDWAARSLGQLKGSRSTRQKRTDEGGNARTVAQRRKMYMLTAALGWNDDNQRISAFAKRITGVERIEWLDTAQCNMVIEALKDMVARGAERHSVPSPEQEAIIAR